MRLCHRGRVRSIRVWRSTSVPIAERSRLSQSATTPPHSSRRHRSAYCKTTVLVYTCEEPSPLISPPGLLETCYCRAISSFLDNVMAAMTPPSQIMSVPVRYPALSLAQNARSSAISPGWPKRFRAPI